jgi:hypothetical protein
MGVEGLGVFPFIRFPLFPLLLFSLMADGRTLTWHHLFSDSVKILVDLFESLCTWSLERILRCYFCPLFSFFLWP